jgi:hypothetical protein
MPAIVKGLTGDVLAALTNDLKSSLLKSLARAQMRYSGQLRQG